MRGTTSRQVTMLGVLRGGPMPTAARRGAPCATAVSGSAARRTGQLQTPADAVREAGPQRAAADQERPALHHLPEWVTGDRFEALGHLVASGVHHWRAALEEGGGQDLPLSRHGAGDLPASTSTGRPAGAGTRRRSPSWPRPRCDGSGGEDAMGAEHSPAESQTAGPSQAATGGPRSARRARGY